MTRDERTDINWALWVAVVVFALGFLVGKVAHAENCSDYYDVNLGFKSDTVYFESYTNNLGKDYDPKAWHEFPTMTVDITQSCKDDGGHYFYKTIAKKKIMVSGIRYTIGKSEGNMLARVLRDFPVDMPNDVGSFFEKPLNEKTMVKK